MDQFEHGGQINAFSNLAGCTPEQVLDFSSNINFLRPEVPDDFANNVMSVPYPSYDELSVALQQRYSPHSTPDLFKSSIELFNGASSAIFSLLRFLRHKYSRCLLDAPFYSEYKRAAEINGYEIIKNNRFDSDSISFPENSLVIIVNPSTPDGKLIQDPLKIIEECRSKNSALAIDESFLDFADADSLIPLSLTDEKLFIIKSMTKFYSAAGPRLGFITSTSANITNLRYIEPLWKVSAFDSAYFIHALRDSHFYQRSRELNKANLDLLKQILRKQPFISEIFPPSANFAMVKLEGITAGELQEKLLPYRILFRNCENFDFLDSSFARFAVKDKDSLLYLEKAFKEIS